jgi:hypothetical protein
MSEAAVIMKREIRLIAKYRALIISKYFITLLLCIMSLYLGIMRYALSPFYILLVLNILPPVLNHVIREYSGKNRLLSDIRKDQPFKLKLLKNKYKYTRLNYVSNSISYLSALLLIGMWQYNYSASENMIDLIVPVPVIILAAGIFVRLLGIIFYQLKLSYDLSHNRM